MKSKNQKKVLPESFFKYYIIAKEGNEDMINLVNKALDQFLASDDYTQLCEKYGLKQLKE